MTLFYTILTFMTACFKMLELFLSGYTVIAGGVRVFVNTLKYFAHVNYELVATVIKGVTHAAALMVSGCCQLKQIILAAAVTTVDFVHEVYIILMITLTTVWKSIICISNGLQFVYANVTNGCLFCFGYISACCLSVAQTVIFISNILALSANVSINLAITAVSTLFLAVTTVGGYCYYFVTGVWQGLGFVLSSVALFPSFCFQSLNNMWMKSLEMLTNVLTVTTKETYLGIIVLCLVYLTLSNTFRYLYSKGLPMFPRRMRSRRARDHTTHWQFDRGFESDFDDLYSSDTEDVSWVAPVEIHDSDADSDVDDDGDDDRIDQDSDNSENNSDADDESNLEESDSDASINSHTFSTESSDHEIDVQLPPVDKCYSLCSRSSTPSRVSKTVSPEEFNIEMERERDKRKCVICQDQIKSVLILPCRHMCMCVLCAGQIVRSSTIGRRVCPLCRTRITKVMNVYV